MTRFFGTKSCTQSFKHLSTFRDGKRKLWFWNPGEDRRKEENKKWIALAPAFWREREWFPHNTSLDSHLQACYCLLVISVTSAGSTNQVLITCACSFDPSALDRAANCFAIPFDGVHSKRTKMCCDLIKAMNRRVFPSNPILLHSLMQKRAAPKNGFRLPSVLTICKT